MICEVLAMLKEMPDADIVLHGSFFFKQLPGKRVGNVIPAGYAANAGASSHRDIMLISSMN